MLGLLIEGLILIAILSVLTGEDFVGNDVWVYIKAGFLAFCTAILGMVLLVAFATVLPAWAAIVLAPAIAAVGLGFAISYFYDVEIKRAMIGAVTYFVISIIVRLILNNVFSSFA